jgi:DNA-3-methyladenine glycosylase
MEQKNVNQLTSSFYTREDVVQIARDLLGKYLVTNFDHQIATGKIVETEAYRGPEDKASHAWMNRRTNRTEVMFGEGGHAYVYLCYGIHHLFNIVTGTPGMPHAVLIRAIEPVDNVDVMLKRRNMKEPGYRLAAGPGTLSQALGIRTVHSGLSLVRSDALIWIEDRDEKIQEENILASPRVGVEYAGECALWDWRFRIRGSKWTSQAK